MRNLDINHQEVLDKFRAELLREGILREGDSIGTDDDTLMRFLKARTFDLRQAKKMFINCQNWRKTVDGIGIDEMYSRIDPFDYPGREAIFECWPMWFHKTDKKGRPVNIQAFGGMDINKLYQVCAPERHWQIFLVNAEALTREVLPAASRSAGKKIGTGLVIVDLKGFGLAAFWQIKTLVQNSFQVSQDYYPEAMGQLAIINAPATFALIWNVIRPWLAKETAAKVDILGSNYQKVLLELVDADNLPASLGGNCTCSEAGGCHLSGAGPWQDGRIGWGPKNQAKEVIREIDQMAVGGDMQNGEDKLCESSEMADFDSKDEETMKSASISSTMRPCIEAGEEK